jgi:hypothetical protein
MANRVPVKCSGVQLLAWKTDGYYPFACADACVINVQNEMLTTTTPSSGTWRTRMPSGISDWNVNISMVTVLRDLVNTFWFSWETILESVRKNQVQLKFKLTDTSGYEKYAVGYAWIELTSISMNMTEPFSTSTVNFLSNGALDLSSLITPNNPRVITPRPQWITTGAENGILTDARLIGKTKNDIQQLSGEGDDKWKIIDTGVPVEGREAKFDTTTGSFIFTLSSGQFDANLFFYAIVNA